MHFPKGVISHVDRTKLISWDIKYWRMAAKKLINLCQADNQGACTDVVAHVPTRDEKVERTTLAIADGVQFRVHATLCASDQTATSAFFTARLDAV